MKQISKSIYEEMKCFECIDYSKFNKNYGKTKTKIQVEEGAYKTYLERRKDYVIISKTVFTKLVELKLIDISKTNRDCFKNKESIFLYKDIYQKYLKMCSKK